MNLGEAAKLLHRTSLVFNLFKMRLGDTLHSDLDRGTDPIYKVISGAMRLLQDERLRTGMKRHDENLKLFVKYMKQLFDRAKILPGKKIYRLFVVESPSGVFSDAVRTLEELEESFWFEIDEPLHQYLLTTHWKFDVAQLFPKSVLYRQAHLNEEIAEKIGGDFHLEFVRAVNAAHRIMMRGESIDKESQVTIQVLKLWDAFKDLSMERQVYVSARFLKYDGKAVFDELKANTFERLMQNAFERCSDKGQTASSDTL